MDQLAAMRVFVRVAERGSFSAVAQELLYSPSRVSRQVAELEKLLGATLVTRTTRRMQLTDEGRVYLEHARRALAEIDDGATAVRGGARGLHGHLRLTTGNGIFRYLVFDAIAPLLEANAELSMELVLNDQVVDLVAAGIDLAVRAGAQQDSSLIARKLAELPRVVVASRRYLERSAGRLPAIVTPAALAQHECIQYSGYRGQDWRFSSEAGEISVPVSGRLSFSVGEMAREAVLRDLGVALMPRVLFADRLASGEVVQLLTGFAIAPLPLYAVYPSSRRQVARVEALIEHLLAHFASRPP
jgi:DNA-binding transcriptional LysR family regulator